MQSPALNWVKVAVRWIVPVAFAIGWFILGGIPHDHDRYGKVLIPGKKVMQMPEGDVRVWFEGYASGGENSTIQDQPDGLHTTVVPAAGGPPLSFEKISSSLLSSTSNDRGWEPLGRVDLPEAGEYRVLVSASGGAGAGAFVTLGPKPWNPLGSNLLGAILVFAVSAAAAFFFTLLPRLMSGYRA